MADQPNDKRFPINPEPDPGAMEWLYDTLAEAAPEAMARHKRRFPLGTLVALILGLGALGGLLWLLLGNPPQAQPAPAATVTPTAFVVAVPTQRPLPAADQTPTATTVLTPTRPLPFEIGDRVIIEGTGPRGIRFRAGAGLDFITLELFQDSDAFFILPNSDSAEPYPVEADGYTWWRLRSPDGLIGWTVEDYLVAAPLVAETPTITATVAP